MHRPDPAGWSGALHAAAQGSPFVTRLHFFPTTTSTNDRALELARAGAPHGTLVVADEQTAGRGRLGRRWVSPPGVGLWMSWVLRPALPLSRISLITAAGAVAVGETVERSTGRVATIRWPNDVLSADRKVAGLLAESGGGPAGPGYVVLGIGINVNQEAGQFSVETGGEATSLRLLAERPVDRGTVLALFLESFASYYAGIVRDGGERVRREWVARMPMVGRRIRVTGLSDSFEGTATGVTADGALVVARDDGNPVEVRAADVRLVRPLG